MPPPAAVPPLTCQTNPQEPASFLPSSAQCWTFWRVARPPVVDELNSSLHTLLTRQLVRMFHYPTLPPRNAELIFTEHGTSLLDAHGLLRHDQIWFVGKTADQEPTLFPLTAASAQFNKLRNKLIDGEINKSPAVFHTALPGGAAHQKTRRKRHKPQKGLVMISFRHPPGLRQAGD